MPKKLTQEELAELKVKMCGGFARHEHTLAEALSLFDHIAALNAEIEQLQVQLAGCSVAATGWAKGEQVAKPGDYGYSASYQDVLNLRAKWETQNGEIAELARALRNVSQQLDDTTTEELLAIINPVLAKHPEVK